MQALSISLIYYTKFRYVYCPYFNIQHIQPSKKHERPSRVMTEVTITNIKDHHKGRVDVLAQYPNGCGLLDWKCYDLSKNISCREKC
jgi:hypothetical protein